MINQFKKGNKVTVIKNTKSYVYNINKDAIFEITIDNGANKRYNPWFKLKILTSNSVRHQNRRKYLPIDAQIECYTEDFVIYDESNLKLNYLLF